MKIAFNGLIIDENKAGIGQYGYNIIKHLLKYKGIDYTFFLQKNIDIGYNNVYYKNKYKKSYQRIIDEQLFLLPKYKKHDLIHFIDYGSPIVNINTPFIITLHDLSFYKYPETFSNSSGKIKRFLTPISVKKAALIVVDSKHTKRDVIEHFPFAKKKIRVIYPGCPDLKNYINGQSVEAIKKRYGIKGRYILGVGTVEPRKNIKRLIEAFKIVNKKFNDINLVLVGKKGWLYDEIFSSIENIEIKNHIIYTGYVKQDDMASIYGGAEIFVYPSLYEGFGFPPLEAMVCGIPVVVSNISSLPEVVGDSGIYVNPFEVEDIARGIISLLDNNNLREKLIENGYNRAKIFNWDKTASQIINTYKEILE